MKQQLPHWVMGIHAVENLLLHDAASPQIKRLYLLDGRQDQRFIRLKRLAEEANIPIITLSLGSLSEKAASERHQGVLAECASLPQWQERDIDKLLESSSRDPLILILDGVQDPHNLGACLRTANGAGVDLVLAPRDKAASMTPAVRKVACGAAELTPFVQVANLARTLRHLKSSGVWLVGASDMADTTLYQLDLRGPLAWVLGAEGKGLRKLSAELCDHLVSIPMAGPVSSLNVSVAAGVCLYETARQRLASFNVSR